MKFTHWLYLLFTLSFLTANTTVDAKSIAADSSNSAAKVNEGSIIRAVRFNGNYNINQTTLEGLARTKTNRELFEIPRFTFRYFLWKINHKWGEPPKRLNREVVGRDIERIQLYYRSLGYFQATVDTLISPIKSNRCIVTFNIDEGFASTIDSVFYKGFPDELISNGQVEEFVRASVFNKTQVNDTLIIAKRQYREDLIENEHNRVIAFLKNNGFASVIKDSVTVLVRTSSDKLRNDLLFDMQIGKKHKFGDITLRLNEANWQSYRQERLYTDTTFAVPPKKVIIRKNDSEQTKYSTIVNQLQVRAGEDFNQAQFDLSLSKLQNLGMLSVLSSGTGIPDRTHQYDSLYVPMYIQLQSLPKHRVTTELFGLQRFGFGTGVNVNYTNNNVLGGAEQLKFSFNGSFEYLTDNSITRLRGLTDSLSQRLIDSRLLQSLETSVSYSIPKLGFPFINSPWNKRALSTKTEYSVTHSMANQIFFDINLELRFNWRFNIQHTTKTSSFIDFLELEWLDTTPQAAYLEQLERFYQDPVLVAFAREDFRPQFTSIIRYRYQNSTVDPIKRDEGYFQEYSIALAGNLPYLLDRYAITPGEIENSLPALGISGNRIEYAQFVKLTADLRKYVPMDLDNESLWAARFFVGFIHPYGNNPDVPINRRFFAGGNNDIRSFNVFRLGPGGLSSNEVPRNGGEIKLMFQSEIRQRFLTNFMAANWYSVLFAETGNIWYGFRDLDLPPAQLAIIENGRFRLGEFYKQLPLVGGYGLRLDWDFVILRLDLAFRFRDAQSQWFNRNRPFFAFGIGHSF